MSAKYFDVLGIAPLLGPGFTGDEDRPNGPNAALLSYDLWKSLYNLDPQITGKTVLLKGEPYVIAGVMPAGTQTTAVADLWTPLRPSRSGEGGGTNYRVVMRLHNGASWLQVNAKAGRLRPQLFSQFSKGSSTWLYVLPLQQQLALTARGPVLMLLLAVSFVLLLACANLAGVMLVRVTRRCPEITTRMALGASRIVILRNILLEPFILSLLGGAAGLALAITAFKVAARLVPQDMLPLGGFALDGRVLLFTAAVSVGTSLLVGILPALEIRKLDFYGSMSGGLRSATGGKHRMRQIFIAAQVTLTVVLLAGAGLLVRTLVYLQTLPSGCDPTNVMTARLSLDDVRYRDAAAFRRLLDQSLAKMQRIPGVESAAVGLSLPYEQSLNDSITVADGNQKGQGYITSFVYVTPDYFRALRMPILAGRGFTGNDTGDSQPVAVVNKTFAHTLLGSSDAIGRHFECGRSVCAVVGIVADVVKPPGATDDTAPLTNEPTAYVPATQMSQKRLNLIHSWFQPSWLVRTNGPVSGLTGAMQKALADADPNLPFSGFHSINDLNTTALVYQRLEVALLGLLAGLALLLSLVGIYSLVSNLVAQRTREIGIRMALGSTVSRAMMEIGKSGMIAVACGLAGGLALSTLTLRIIQSQLYGVRAHDPATLAAVLALLTLAALAASFLPTLRISRIDPAVTLRAE